MIGFILVIMIKPNQPLRIFHQLFKTGLLASSSSHPTCIGLLKISISIFHAFNLLRLFTCESPSSLVTIIFRLFPLEGEKCSQHTYLGRHCLHRITHVSSILLLWAEEATMCTRILRGWKKIDYHHHHNNHTAYCVYA